MTAITILPAPFVAVEKPVVRPYALLAALQVADVGLTGLVLSVGGAEQNPLARVLTDMGWTGLSLLLIIKLCLVCLLFQRQSRVRLASAVYSLVVVNNALMLALRFWPT